MVIVRVTVEAVSPAVLSCVCSGDHAGEEQVRERKPAAQPSIAPLIVAPERPFPIRLSLSSDLRALARRDAGDDHEVAAWVFNSPVLGQRAARSDRNDFVRLLSRLVPETICLFFETIMDPGTRAICP